jgi:hypothetical protein
LGGGGELAPGFEAASALRPPANSNSATTAAIAVSCFENAT